MCISKAVWWEDDPSSLRHELVTYGNTTARGKRAGATPLDDWTSVLTAPELKRHEQYMQIWRDRFGTDPMEDARAAWSLNQEPMNRRVMTSADGVLPCLLAQGT